MARSSKFDLALTVLAELARARPDAVSSAALGATCGAHPVVVRRLLAALAAAGMVETKGGKEGGARLARGPKRITLREIYEAVESAALVQRRLSEGATALGEGAVRRAEQAFLKALDKATLKEILAAKS